MDGWITIGTKLDSKQLDKDLKDAQRRLQQFERENERLTTAKSKVELDLQAYEKQKLAIQESTNEMLKLAQTEEQVNNVLSMEETELNTLNQQYSEQFQKVEEINQKLQENVRNQGLVKNQIQGITQELNKTSAFDNIKKSIDNIGNSVEKVTKKVGKWALAVFGLRSAYMFIRQSVSTLSQYNDQIATDVEYIRFALATALQPVIEFIIQLAYKLLSLIGYIAKALFGVNIFANSSADAFKRAKDSLGGANKEAKQLQKTLAGFDEMNILQEDGSTAVGGGGGGISMPSFDFGDEEFDTSSIYTWTTKVKEIIGNAFDGIKSNVKKVMIDLGFSQEYIDAWEQTVGGIEQTIGGAIDVVGGILEIIVGLFEGDTAKVEDGIMKVILGIMNIIKGIPTILAGIWKQILTGIYDFLIKPIIDNFSNLIDAIKTALKIFWEWISNKFNNVVSFFKTIFDVIGIVFSDVASTIGEVIGNALKGVINTILTVVEGILNTPISAINGFLAIVSWIPGIGDIVKLPYINLPRLAKGGIVNMPGRGVPVGNAIAGERGQEGVIPLTDSQQMALLGEAIGKYININATVPVYIGNRQVAREIRKIEAEDNFAYNG